MEHLLNKAARPPPPGGRVPTLKSVEQRLKESLKCLDHGAPSALGRGQSRLSISNAAALRRVPIHSGHKSAASAADVPLDSSASNSWTVNCVSEKKRKSTKPGEVSLYVTPATKRARRAEIETEPTVAADSADVEVVPPSATPGAKHSVAALEALDGESIEEKWQKWSQFDFGFQGRPTTESLGWRRLTLPEILHLSKGSFFILIVPGDRRVRNEDPGLNSSKNEFLKRIMHVVYKSNEPMFRKVGKPERASKIREHLESVNGIIRHDQVYLEFPSVLSAWANREEYANPDFYSKEDVGRHFREGAGIGISLLDHPSPETLDIKFSEINSVQFFVPCRRGDARPRVCLKLYRHLERYESDLMQIMPTVHDDVVQCLELKIDILSNKLRIAQAVSNNSTKSTSKVAPPAKSIHTFESGAEFVTSNLAELLLKEMDTKQVQNIALQIDQCYYDAIVVHFTTFHKAEELVHPTVRAKIYALIQEKFPIHFAVLESLIFTRRNHEPMNRSKPVYAKKQMGLINHFLAMLRLRNKSLLVHWAIVGTLALHGRGMPANMTRNPVLSSFACKLETALAHVRKIHEATAPVRMKLYRNVPVGIHSSDNFNRYHAHGIQAGPKAGIMHLGMVFNMVIPKQWSKPPGTTLRFRPDQSVFRVVQSSLMDPWRETLEQAKLNDHEKKARSIFKSWKKAESVPAPRDNDEENDDDQSVSSVRSTSSNCSTQSSVPAVLHSYLRSPRVHYLVHTRLRRRAFSCSTFRGRRDGLTDGISSDATPRRPAPTVPPSDVAAAGYRAGVASWLLAC